MFDVILLSVAGGLQILITVYTVVISVRDNRAWNAAVIFLLGAIAVGLTAWAGYHSYAYQEQLKTELTNINKELSGAQVGLFDLGLRPPIQELIPGKDIQMGMAIRVSEGTAKSMRCSFDAFTLPGNESDEQNRAAIARFRQTMAKDGPATGEDRLAGSGCYRGLLVKLNESEIKEVVADKRTIYIMGHAEWKNEAGADFHSDFYKWMEPPKTRTIAYPGWHDCAE